MRYYEIVEARRNPEQNPKVSTLDALKVYAGRDDVFVSFTSDVGFHSHSKNGSNPDDPEYNGKNTSGSKLGINPKSKWDTPIGIYTYPVDNVISKKGDVEWESDAPFLYVVQSTKPLLDLNNYTEADFEKDSEKLIDMGFEDTRDWGIKNAKFDTPACRLWNWTRLAAYYKTRSSKFVPGSLRHRSMPSKGKPSVQWTKILRELGYSGAVDRGSKVIHDNEPNQAVFFSINAIKVLKVIPNKFVNYRPLTKYQEALNRIKEYLFSKSSERNEEIEKDLMLTKSGSACVSYMDKVKKKEDYPLILQQLAVQQYGWAIKYINNPSEELQLLAVTKTKYAIQSIENPSEAVQLAAVESNVDAIKFIKNPSEAVQLAAVQQSTTAFKLIKNPTEAAQLAAVTKNKKVIKHIKNPSEAVKKAAGL